MPRKENLKPISTWLCIVSGLFLAVRADESTQLGPNEFQALVKQLELLPPSNSQPKDLDLAAPKENHPADFDLPIPKDLPKSDHEKGPSKEHPNDADKFTLHLDKELENIARGNYTYTLPSGLLESEFLNFVVAGFGSITVIALGADDEVIFHKELTIDALDESAMVPILNPKFGKTGHRLVVLNDSSLDALSLKLQKNTILPVRFNENAQVVCVGDMDVPFRVTLFKGTHVEADSRIQFIISSSLEEQVLHGNEKLAMFINEGKQVPTAAKHDTKSSAILGSGVIKTLTKGDALFCDSGTCEFTVTVSVKGVDVFNFFPSLFSNKAKVSFKRMMTLLEELEPGKSVEYEFDETGSKDNWVFTVKPYEGSVDMYINEDSESTDPSKAQYYASSTRKENLVITAKEETAGSTMKESKKFWVMFRNTDTLRPTTFEFKMRRMPEGTPFKIGEAAAENGSLVKGEVQSFLLDKKQVEEELIKLELRLEVLTGSADLLLKICFMPSMPCQVTVDDFKQTAEEIPDMTDNNSGTVRLSRWNPQTRTHFISQFVRCINGEVFDVSMARTQNYPLSLTCNFAIGVRSVEVSNDNRTRFKLTAYGHGVLVPLILGEATMVKKNVREEKRFEVNVGEPTQEGTIKELELRVVSLAGSCMIYYSKTTRKPCESDNDGFVFIDNQNGINLNTLNFHEKIPFAHTNSLDDDMLYIAVTGFGYATLDITPVITYGQNEEEGWERIVEYRVYHRQVNEAELNMIADPETKQTMVGYTRKFVYAIDRRVAAISNEAEIHIVVDSPVLGLRICIQELSQRAQSFNQCRFFSTGNHLTLHKSELFKNGIDSVVIAVQKIAAKDAFVRLPIDFSLKVTTDDNFAPVELVRSGHSYTSKLHKGASQEFFVDLLAVKTHFSLMFESADPDMFVQVMIESEKEPWGIGKLDLDTFALEIKNLGALKARNCSHVCNAILSVYTTSGLSERFTLTYQRDDISIMLKEGEHLSFPNNKPALFAFQTDGTQPVSFSVHNDRVEASLSAKLVDVTKTLEPLMLVMEISALKFDFKTNIETDPEITIPILALHKHAPNGVVFLYSPWFKTDAPNHKDSITFYDHKNRATVNLHSKLLRLKPFLQSKFSVSASDTLYFMIDLDSHEDFSVILTLSSGQALMFLNHGDGNLPTAKKHWRRTSNANGDEIVVTQAELAKQAGNSGQFYLGVTGLETAKFGLLFLPAFHNLIKVKFQHLLDLKLDEGKNYFFDYLNTHEHYETLFYADGSDVEVAALNYDKLNTDFATMTTDESNYHQKFEVKAGDIPRTKEFNRVIETATTTVVRVKASKGAGRLNFAIFDAKHPLEVSTGRRFKFSQDAGKNYSFAADLGDTYDEVEVSVRLESGSIEFTMSDDLKFTDASEPVSMSSPGEQSVFYKVKTAKQVSDIVIFNQFFLRVKSAKFSRYSVRLQPKDKFRMVKAFEPEVIRTSKSKETFVYFALSAPMARSVHNLVIDVTRPEGFGDRPDMLFVAESDVVLNAESPYLPMPINDIFERISGDFVHFEIRPETQAGYYVLRFDQSEAEFPVKVEVSYNDMRNVEVNSLQKGAVPESAGKSHEYSMFVAESGEVRIMVESCHSLVVESARFYGSTKMTPVPNQEDRNEYNYDEKTGVTQIKFNQQFLQTSPYLRLTTTRFAKTATKMGLTSHIVRAFFTEPGILKFRITRADKGEETRNHMQRLGWLVAAREPDPTYVMMTEFRPMNIDLILKDYIQLFDSNEELHNMKLTHWHSKTTGDVFLTIRIPTFKPQFNVDYPEVQFATMKLNFHVFADPDFEDKLHECGMACLDDVPHSLTTHVVNFTREDLRNAYRNANAEITFTGKQLEVLRGSHTFRVFCSLFVRWFVDEAEANQIFVDPKHTHVPYFLLSFPYREHSALYIFIAVGLACSILAFGVWSWRQKRQREGHSKKYVAANTSINTSRIEDVEISSVSRQRWRDEQV